jgi:glycosyltransferase involved in cell wall biosynthesis
MAESCCGAISINFKKKTISISGMVFYFTLIMKIAVNARSLNDTGLGAGYYTLHLFAQLIQQESSHTFVLLSDASVDFICNSNASVSVLGKPAKGMFTLRRWLDSKVKRELKLLNADVFISLDGNGILKTSIPQIIGITDLSFLQRGSFVDRIFERNRFRKIIDKANAIVTVSENVKRKLVAMYPAVEKKISIVPKAPKDIFKPLPLQERENIKATYADGKDYFLFTGGFDASKNLLNVLKAFSQFKKWQQSEMKLIITGNTSDEGNGMKQKIETFKFRQDVVLLNKVQSEQLAFLMASGYALVYPSLVESYGMPVLEAMHCGTAVVTSKNVSAAQMTGDVALYADPNDAEDIAAQMIKLYKDEDLRSELIKDAIAESAKINWKNSAQLLWEVIERTAQ